MNLPWWVNVRCSISGFLALRRRAGFHKALYYGIASRLRPDPFVSLPPPTGEAEVLSRRQIGPAVKLYAALKTRLGKDRAIEIVRPVITAATQTFLSWAFGRPDTAALGRFQQQRGWPLPRPSQESSSMPKADSEK